MKELDHSKWGKNKLSVHGSNEPTISVQQGQIHTCLTLITGKGGGADVVIWWYHFLSHNKIESSFLLCASAHTNSLCLFCFSLVSLCYSKQNSKLKQEICNTGSIIKNMFHCDWLEVHYVFNLYSYMKCTQWRGKKSKFLK